MTHTPLDFRKSFTNAEFILHLYKLSIDDLNYLLDWFDNYGMQDDCDVIQKVLNEKINLIVTRVN